MKLNLGSHGEEFPGYISVDLYHPDARVKADASDLPYDDSSIEEILAFHILEHFRAGHYEPELSNPLNPKTAEEALREWYRVLRPGGLLQVKVPDFDKILWLMRNYPQWALAKGSCPPFPNFVDWICSNGQHQCLFTKTIMEEILARVGFERIEFVDSQPKSTIDRGNVEMHVICYKKYD